ncbi:hypothetical protein CRE_18522 [Caenorhabditis remanei]|uniref:Fungal lipase-type domain-containing protein n=1 Tax=Caenorhabditis remanei TaxID=31234 RepID=E3LLC1_CAERE|nr:hypothetical protein CRE_18522 [Caenorhabditis remanei]
MRPLLFFLLPILSLSIPLGKQTGYDDAEARRLVKLAAAAYGDRHATCISKAFGNGENFHIENMEQKSCDHLDSTCAAYAVVSDSTKRIIVVFRGTKSKSQLFLEGWQSVNHGIDFFDMGDVNRYFLNAHLVLWPEIEKVITNPRWVDYEITFTGHSLGGALAALAAARTAKQGYRPGNMIKVYTFGQPRVGTRLFARNFDALLPNTYRVVFRRDIVPHMPACHKNQTFISEHEGGAKPCHADHLDYYHHGTEIWYPDEMTPGAHYVECLGAPKNEDFACSDRIKFFIDQSESYTWDHRHYFAVKVPPYGKTGCDDTMPEGKPSVFENVVKRLNLLTRTIGLD